VHGGGEAGAPGTHPPPPQRGNPQTDALLAALQLPHVTTVPYGERDGAPTGAAAQQMVEFAAAAAAALDGAARATAAAAAAAASGSSGGGGGAPYHDEAEIDLDGTGTLLAADPAEIPL
jgi:hypothetical protein